jgi:hypothetical protein
MSEPLDPVREALLAACRADVARVAAGAEAAAEARLSQGREAAGRIRGEARAQGAASGAAAAAVERTRARRVARADVLRVQRDAYWRLRSNGRAAVGALRDEPDWPGRQAALAAAVARALGPGATVREAADGGVIGEAPGRRVDCSLAMLADRATDAVAQHLGVGT